MSEHITHTSTKRLERSSSDRMVAGVSGGLGRYFDLNPAFFRLGFVVLTLLGGAGILIYLAAVLVIPNEGEDQAIAQEALAGRRDRPWPLIGLGLVAVALAVLLSRATWPAAGIGWVLVLFVGLAILWSSRDASRSSRRARVLVRSLVALLVTLFVAAIVAVTVAFSWFDVSLADGVGDRVEAPANSAALDRSYELGIGDLRVDLSGIGVVMRETHVRAKVGIGELRIIVPRDASVAVSAHAKAGEVNVLGNHEEGRNAELESGAGGLLVIDARVGAGKIDVVRSEG